MTPNSPLDSRLRGPWSVEPVHDALITAKMRDLRGARGDERAPTDAFTGSAAATTSPPRRHFIRGVRGRLGRALVAVGSFIEGPCDCPDAAGVGVG